MEIVVVLISIVITVILLRKDYKLVYPIIFMWVTGIVYALLVHREELSFAYPIMDPLLAIKQYWKFRDASGSWKYQYLSGIVMNILIFVPLGCCIPAVGKREVRYKTVFVTGVFCSVSIESAQLFSRRGYFDIADIINNSIGTIIGAAIFFSLISEGDHRAKHV